MNHNNYFLILTVFILSPWNVCGGLVDDNQTGSKHVRSVSLAMSITRLVDFDERTHLLQMQGHVTVQWHEPSLRWNSTDGIVDDADIRNLYHFKLAKDVWMPTIMARRFDDPTVTFFSAEGKKVELRRDGRVRALYSGPINTSCDMSYDHFPFDKQVCKFSFTKGDDTFEFGSSQLLADQAASGLSNPKWTLMLPGQVRRASQNQLLVLSIKIARNGRPFEEQFIWPGLLLFAVHFIIFLLPINENRLSCRLSLALAFTLFFQLLLEKLPSQGNPLTTFIELLFWAGTAVSIGDLILLVVKRKKKADSEVGGRVNFSLCFIAFIVSLGQLCHRSEWCFFIEHNPMAWLAAEAVFVCLLLATLYHVHVSAASDRRETSSDTNKAEVLPAMVYVATDGFEKTSSCSKMNV